MRRSAAQLLVWLLFVLGAPVLGCSGPDLSKALAGYWTTSNDQGFLELGPSGLYARRLENAPLEVGHWSLVGHTLKLQARSGEKTGEQTVWEIKMPNEVTFEYSISEAQFRRYRKSERRSELFEPRLSGLWKSSGGAELFEFTPRGTLIGLTEATDEDGETRLDGTWARVESRGPDMFRLSGLSGQEPLPVEQINEVSFDGVSVDWTSGEQQRVLHPTSDAFQPESP